MEGPTGEARRQAAVTALHTLVEGRQKFVKKLRVLLNDKDWGTVVTWAKDGRGFMVNDVDAFCSQCLPLWWTTANMRSFQRTASNWGFKKHTMADGRVRFTHAVFHRDRPSEDARLSRRRPQNAAARKRAGSVTSTSSAVDPAVAEEREKLRAWAIALARREAQLKRHERRIRKVCEERFGSFEAAVARIVDDSAAVSDDETIAASTLPASSVVGSLVDSDAEDAEDGHESPVVMPVMPARISSAPPAPAAWRLAAERAPAVAALTSETSVPRSFGAAPDTRLALPMVYSRGFAREYGN